jgi:carboxymethylenebutenolidase
MKKISLLIVIAASIYSTTFAQVKSCCSTNATADFAMLGKDAGFQSAHLSPEPFNFTPAKGSDITFTTPDSSEAKAFFVKADVSTHNYLFIFHEWWGLNDYIKREAERFASELGNVNVIALDMYDGKVTTNPEEATQLMQSMTKQRGEAIITGAQQFIGPSAKIQTLGWCFGGGWSLQAAILLSEKSKGCVMYYGMPERDEARLRKLSCPVLGIFGSKDNWINKDMVDSFEKQAKNLNKDVKIKFYDADHAFANPSNPKYSKDFAEDAHAEALKFLKKNY